MWAALSALLTGAAGAALIGYSARGLIGAGVASAWLKAQGVASALRIERLDATGFTGAVRLGDPSRPDFVSDHVELDFSPALGLRAARIVEPRLRARFDGRRLTFGGLQPMIDRALAAKPTGAPGPEIRVDRGLALVETPLGPLRLVADARLAQGRLQGLDARLLTARLVAPDGEADVTGARLLARGVPGGVRGRLSLTVARARFRAASLSGAVLQTDVDAATAGLLPTSPMRLSGFASAAAFAVAGTRLDRPALRWRVHGGATGLLDRLSLTGDGEIAVTAARAVRAGGLDGSGLRLVLASDALHLTRTGSRAQIDGPLTMSGQADRLASGAAALTGVRLHSRLTALKAAALDPAAAIELDATGEVRADAAQARLAGTLLTAASAEVKGRARASTLGDSRFDGGLTLAGGASLDQARRWVKGVPLISTQLARALTRVAVIAPSARLGRSEAGGLTLSGVTPIRALGAGGATLTLSSLQGSPLVQAAPSGAAAGAFDLTLQGAGLPTVRITASRYTVGRDRGGLAGRLDATLNARGDAGAARGVDLNAPAVVERREGTTVARLSGCAPLAVAQYGATASKVAASLCPLSHPLLQADGGRWRVATEVREAQAVLDQASLRLSGDAVINAGGGVGNASGAAEITRLQVRDLAAKRRFEPLAASGSIRLSDTGWRGELGLALTAGKPLGHALLTATTDISAGSVSLDTGVLTFAQNGLQPSAISPLAPTWLSKVDGPARFTGRVAWQGPAIDSDGRLETSGLDATGPLGRMTRARGALQFTSLTPLTTAPGQTLEADGVAWIAPLSEVRVRLQLLPDAVRLEAAKATVSNGQVSLDPLTVALQPGAKLAGVVRLAGVDAGDLMARSTLSDKLSLKARLSGAIPFQTGPDGVRFTNGRLAADGPGRLSLNRRALTAGAVQTPVGQDLAYQALEDLAFDALDATVNSQDKGRLGVLFHIKGRHDPPRLKEARVGLFDLLAGRALQKPLDLPSGTPVNLTLDTSLNFDELLAAYRQADRRGSEPVQDGGAK